MRNVTSDSASDRPGLRTVWLVAAALCLGVALLGCSPKSTGTASPTPAATNASRIAMPTQAQPKLPTIKMYVGAQELTVELARTQIQWATGMMFRKSIGEQEGMLFVFPQPHQAAFYMKNTQVPLSCAYIDPDGQILEIHDLEPFNENSVPASTDRVQYVLETAQGWFKRNQVNVGMAVRTERGTLLETFFSRR